MTTLPPAAQSGSRVRASPPPLVSVSPIGRAGMILGGLDRFVRLHFVGFTAMWGLLGVFSSDPRPGPAVVLAVTLLGVSFHLFGSVLNDLIDLPIDRTQPLRAGDALVTGSVSVGGATVLVVAQLPIMASVALAFGGSEGLRWLGVALLAMTAYDVWGKRCPWPWLTDAVQGVAFLALTYLGASLAAGPNTMTACIAVSGLLYIILVNGIHGGLRDLGNDRAHGAATTALWLGIRPARNGTITVPRRAWWYCYAILGLHCAASGAVALSGGLGPRALWTAIVLVGTTNVVVLRMMGTVLRPASAGWPRTLRLHVGLLLVPMLIAVLFIIPPGAAAYLLVVFLTPLLLLEIAQEVLGLAGE